MSKTKVINKGYTLTVVSWENDADNYQTHSTTVQTIEEAKAWYDMMQLCRSRHNRTDGSVRLGNTTDSFTEQQLDVVKALFEKHPVLKDLVPGVNFEDDDEIHDAFTELASELLGNSEWYVCRVMDKCTVTYSPENVYLETVTF